MVTTQEYIDSYLDEKTIVTWCACQHWNSNWVPFLLLGLAPPDQEIHEILDPLSILNLDMFGPRFLNCHYYSIDIETHKILQTLNLCFVLNRTLTPKELISDLNKNRGVKTLCEKSWFKLGQLESTLHQLENGTLFTNQKPQFFQQVGGRPTSWTYPSYQSQLENEIEVCLETNSFCPRGRRDYLTADENLCKFARQAHFPINFKTMLQILIPIKNTEALLRKKQFPVSAIIAMVNGIFPHAKLIDGTSHKGIFHDDLDKLLGPRITAIVNIFFGGSYGLAIRSLDELDIGSLIEELLRTEKITSSRDAFGRTILFLNEILPLLQARGISLPSELDETKHNTTNARAKATSRALTADARAQQMAIRLAESLQSVSPRITKKECVSIILGQSLCPFAKQKIDYLLRFRIEQFSKKNPQLTIDQIGKHRDCPKSPSYGAEDDETVSRWLGEAGLFQKPKKKMG